MSGVIAIVGAGYRGNLGLMLHLINRLQSEGCGAIVVIDEPAQPKESEAVKVLLSSAYGRVPSIPEPEQCKLDVDDWKRQRDYPTLKQGLRDPHFRKRHRR